MDDLPPHPRDLIEREREKNPLYQEAERIRLLSRRLAIRIATTDDPYDLACLRAPDGHAVEMTLCQMLISFLPGHDPVCPAEEVRLLRIARCFVVNDLRVETKVVACKAIYDVARNRALVGALEDSNLLQQVQTNLRLFDSVAT